MDGTAVATIVESSATNDVLSISAIRIGPRSDRKPTAPAAAGAGVFIPGPFPAGRGEPRRQPDFVNQVRSNPLSLAG